MRADPAPPEVTAAVGQVDRLEATITTLLSVARDLPLEADGTDLLELLRTVAVGWRTALARRGRDLTLDLPAAAPRSSAHVPVVREILEILIDNAITHGAGTVHLKVRSGDAGAWLDLDVRDEGEGLDADPDSVFSQGQPSTPARHGIGLPLARALALAENGTLTLSHPGPEPCFTLRLPAVPPNAPR
ncbi:MAG: ATP-binding protein [Thermoleophilia bacterium]